MIDWLFGGWWGGFAVAGGLIFTVQVVIPAIFYGLVLCRPWVKGPNP